jgi:hypothetical protein
VAVGNPRSVAAGNPPRARKLLRILRTHPSHRACPARKAAVVSLTGKVADNSSRRGADPRTRIAEDGKAHWRAAFIGRAPSRRWDRPITTS